MIEQVTAFPVKAEPYSKDDQAGMTLRDYFASKALQGMCANMNDDHNPYEMPYAEYIEEIANSAYQLADAMMKERQQ
jgi:hypothetical protein